MSASNSIVAIVWLGIQTFQLGPPGWVPKLRVPLGLLPYLIVTIDWKKAFVKWLSNKPPPPPFQLFSPWSANSKACLHSKMCSAKVSNFKDSIEKLMYFFLRKWKKCIRKKDFIWNSKPIYLKTVINFSSNLLTKVKALITKRKKIYLCWRKLFSVWFFLYFCLVECLFFLRHHHHSRVCLCLDDFYNPRIS